MNLLIIIIYFIKITHNELVLPKRSSLSLVETLTSASFFCESKFRSVAVNVGYTPVFEISEEAPASCFISLFGVGSSLCESFESFFVGVEVFRR